MKLVATIALALLTAAIAVPIGAADPGPDAFERAVIRHLAANGPSSLERADRHYSTLQTRLEDPNRLDPAIARAITANQSAASLVDGRSPDTLDAALHAQTPSISDGRSPDTVDAGLQAQTRIEQVGTRSGFDWGDFAIGATSMLGLVVLVGLLRAAILVRSRRAHPSPA